MDFNLTSFFDLRLDTNKDIQIIFYVVTYGTHYIRGAVPIRVGVIFENY